MRMLVAILLLFFLAPLADAQPANFVGRRGVQFVLNGKPFYFNGFNSYWLMVKAANYQRNEVDLLLNQAQALGLTVCRTWAFFDRHDGLQTSPGVFANNYLQGLDYVLVAARKRGIRVVLTLVNNMDDYGGRNQYVTWAKQRGEQINYWPSSDSFYTNWRIKGWYKNFARTLILRRNHITGVLYRDDPTIFSWQLMNEPRSLDNSGNTLVGWIREMSQYIKSLDWKHMVSTGSEGFYGNSYPNLKSTNPSPWWGTGGDFIRENQISTVDYGTIHMYLENWLDKPSTEQKLAFVNKWVGNHLRDSFSIIKKPLVIEEFGLPSEGDWDFSKRAQLYDVVYNHVFASKRRGGAFGGAQFWQLSIPNNNVVDHFSVYMWQGKATASIRRQSNRMKSTAVVPYRPQRLVMRRRAGHRKKGHHKRGVGHRKRTRGHGR